MSRYDGLIIPRSYSEYINKTDAATLQQALQLSGVLSGAVAAGDNKAVKSSAVNAALADYFKLDTSITDPNLAYPQKTGMAMYSCPVGENSIITGYSTVVIANRRNINNQSFVVNQWGYPQSNAADMGVYHRVITKKTDSDIVVGEWTKLVDESELNNALAEYGKLKQVINPEELDTDKYKDNGYYSIGSTSNRLNLPIQQVGTLLVYNAKFYIIQEYFLNSSNVVYFRKSLNGGTSWGTWEKLPTETDLLNIPITYKTNANECIPAESGKKSTFCVLAGGENLPTTSGTGHYIIESIRAKTSSGAEFVIQNAINFDNNTMYIRRAVYNGSVWTFNAWK